MGKKPDVRSSKGDIVECPPFWLFVGSSIWGKMEGKIGDTLQCPPKKRDTVRCPLSKVEVKAGAEIIPAENIKRRLAVTEIIGMKRQPPVRAVNQPD